MSSSDGACPVEAIRFKDVYGVFVRSPDDVQFRTGSLSGTACVVSDPERRGLLGSIIERLLSPEAMQRRPWNQAEIELLEEVIPQLQQSGIVEVDGKSAASTQRGARLFRAHIGQGFIRCSNCHSRSRGAR